MDTARAGPLRPRHIQDYSSNSTEVAYWGYASRVLPCTNDAGSCAYLDVVYRAHEVGMWYTGILWATIAAILIVWTVSHHSSRPRRPQPRPPTSASDAEKAAATTAPPLAPASPTAPTTASPGPGGLSKLRRALAAGSRHYLLPEAPRRLFGRTTRLQVAVLVALAGYLAVWSFVGITYKTWITPVKTRPGAYNTRTSLGPWSDRVGVLAFALTPLSVLLATRESLLSQLTGVPYQSFSFLHRWVGYIVGVQSALHTVGWCVVEARLYQPQPSVGRDWIRQTYMVWGVVAFALLVLLVGLSTPWAIRRTGYEFFRKAHYLLAMAYIGACWGHWKQLNCFLIPSLLFWAMDRAARLVRTALLHVRRDRTSSSPGLGFGFRALPARVSLFPDAAHGDVVRLDVENAQRPWRIGQHFYLCFAEGSIWQSHPFTPLSCPVVRDGAVVHSYLMRAQSGETKKVADRLATRSQSAASTTPLTTPVILTGAYGEDNGRHIVPENNILCVAGGTGITYVLPALLERARQPLCANRQLELIWAVRRADDLDWVRGELATLRGAFSPEQLRIRIYETREGGTVHGESLETAGNKARLAQSRACSVASGDSSDSRESAVRRRPDLPQLVREFIDTTSEGPTVVLASGPGDMISDLRRSVAECSSGRKVWRGDQRFNVRLVCDDRLEW